MDVSVPISVKGRHWGAARVGVSQDRISERRWRLALALAGMLLAAGALTIEVGRRVVRRATTLSATWRPRHTRSASARTRRRTPCLGWTGPTRSARCPGP